jgi:Tol biopolymer transport system component
MNFLKRISSSILITSFLFGLGITAPEINAQYFGRNKVQYDSFDFKVMKTEHFDIYFYPEFRPAAEQAARMAERWYKRLGRMLNHELRGRQILILYASSPQFQQTSAIPGVLGEGTGGVTEMFKRRIVLPLGASLADTDHVIGHELVHAFQFDITSQDHPRYASAAPTALRLPLWFIEGLAEYLSIGGVDAHTSMWMRDAARRDKLPSVRKLIDPRYFPYRYGQSLWAYITGKWGDSAVQGIMKAVSVTGDYERAIKKVLGVSAEELSVGWHESLKKNYALLADLTELSNPSSRVLVKGTKENRLNVSPALSPDGKQVVFLSTKDLFSIDMYLADAETGQFKRRLITTSVDPHFESLQFIKSAGSWDTQGKRFVFGAISRGQPVLTVVNMESGKNEKEVVFKDLGEILNPTWSPDGNKIAFSALAGGWTDIFIYDLDKEQLERMTHDAYADIHPAWSPDGNAIAFVTERFSTDLSILNIGNLEIGLLNPASGEIKRLAGFNNAKNINPQWASNSENLYFLSDINGISNIYRMNLETQETFQITNLYTGVSGITAVSPSFSVAHKTDSLVFSVYEEDNYSLYTIDSKDVIDEKRASSDFGEIMPSVLPPRNKPEGELLGLLKNPLFGLPQENEFEVEEYKAKLSLDYLAPPQVAVGTDRFGTYVGGGLSLFFSDVLGYHSLFSMFQVNSRIIDSAVLIGYQNTRSRLNWGVVAQRIPYVSRGFTTFIGDALGESAIIEQQYLFRQVNYELSAFTFYPFNQSKRFEVSAGYRLIDFDQEIRTSAFSLFTGAELIREKEKLPAPGSLNFGFASAALVYDTSFFGATGPILGQSYRLEVSPLLGNISYYNFIADYRRYLMPVKPFTLAFRFLHYGRYGKNADDSRLYPLYIGYDGLVRGYNTAVYRTGGVGSPEDYFEIDRLFGSKFIVANFELRFPLFGALGIGSGYYGIYPVDFIAFYDAGIAWSQDEAWFLGGSKKPVSSAGVGLRFNVFGFAVLGVNYVYPFNLPGQGPYLQLSFQPGF